MKKKRTLETANEIFIVKGFEDDRVSPVVFYHKAEGIDTDLAYVSGLC